MATLVFSCSSLKNPPSLSAILRNPSLSWLFMAEVMRRISANRFWIDEEDDGPLLLYDRFCDP